MTTKFAKFGTVLAGAAMAFSFAMPVGAVTVAELQNQINLLMAQLSTLQGGSSTVSTTFTTDLTIGSKGDQVSALQQALVAKNFLKMPAGVAYGYFGNLTKAAVAAWQAANGITPSVGYFGPKSRAAFGSVGGTTTTTTTTTTTGTGITTPGAEGTLTVTTGTVANATVYADGTMVPVLSFKAKAQNSDIAIQRIKIDLAGSSNVYTKAFTKVYLVDEAGTTVASSDLNSTTVVKDNSVYYITLTGFSSVVPKGTTKTFTVKMDVDNSITAASYVIRLAASGVRGVDGAGIDQYSPTLNTDVSKTITVAASLADSAELTLSTAANTPLDKEIVAAEGTSNNQADKVSLLSFDVRASKDNITVTDLVATVTRTAGAATASSTYLYVGDTLVGTASLSLGTATFSDMSVAIAKDTTKTFTLKADIASADSTQTTIDASIAAAGITAENSTGNDVTVKSGSADAYNTLVRNVGPEITLGAHPLVRDSGTIGIANGTSTASATFNLTIKAVGSDIWFGTQLASTTFAFGIHAAGANAATVLTASSTSWSVPSGANTSDIATGQSFKVAEGTSVTIPVTFLFNGRLASGVLLDIGSYAVGLRSVAWSDTKLGTAKSSTFMADKTEWRSNAVTMP